MSTRYGSDMLFVRMKDGSLRVIPGLGSKNWRWLPNGNCEYRFPSDGEVGIVIPEDEQCSETMLRFLRPNPDEPVDSRTGLEGLLDAYSNNE